MYQVEALCNKALWLDQGQVQKLSTPAEVVVAYNNFLETFSQNKTETMVQDSDEQTSKTHLTRFTKIKVFVNGQTEPLIVTSQKSTLTVQLDFVSDNSFVSPSVGIAIFSIDGKAIASSSTHNDAYIVTRDKNGKGRVEIVFPSLPLLKGRYYIDALLANDNALHLYEHAIHVTEFEVIQSGLEQGVVALSHHWKQDV